MALHGWGDADGQIISSRACARRRQRPRLQRPIWMAVTVVLAQADGTGHPAARVEQGTDNDDHDTRRIVRTEHGGAVILLRGVSLSRCWSGRGAQGCRAACLRIFVHISHISRRSSCGDSRGVVLGGRNASPFHFGVGITLARLVFAGIRVGFGLRGLWRFHST